MRGQWANRRDANEPQIVATLRAFGASVTPMDTPCDLLVGLGGRTYAVEVKTPKGKLTPAQKEWAETWRGCFTVLRSTEDAETFAKHIRNAETPAKQGDSA